MDALPTPARHGLLGAAAIVEPAAVVPEQVPVAAGEPAQDRQVVGEQAELGIGDPVRIGLRQRSVDPGGPVPEGPAEGGLVRRPGHAPAVRRLRRERGAQAGDLLLQQAVALPEVCRLVRTHRSRSAPDRGAPDAAGRSEVAGSKAGRRLIPALLQNRPALASAQASPLRGPAGPIVSGTAGRRFCHARTHPGRPRGAPRRRSPLRPALRDGPSGRGPGLDNRQRATPGAPPRRDAATPRLTTCS